MSKLEIPRVVEATRDLRSYNIQKSFDGDSDQVKIDLKLNSNEGCCPDFDFSELISLASLRDYPDKSQLEEQLAKQLGVEPTEVVVTGGADDALDRICRLFLEPGRQFVLPEPTFVMLRQYGTMTGGEIVSIPWRSGPFPVEAVIAETNDTTSMIAMVSPNNPNGLIATIADLKRLAEAVPHVMILVDHAYVEFSDHDLTATALNYPNVVVVRTLSKCWGLAGLRIGYVVGATEVIDLLRRFASPYPVSGPSLAIASSWLKQSETQVADYVSRVKLEVLRLQEFLKRFGFVPSASEANFVFFETEHAKAILQALKGKGIAVRYFSAPVPALRISCPGNDTDLQRLLTSLTDVFETLSIRC